MAKMKMKKIEIAALMTDSKKIIELLQRRGVVELCSSDDDNLVRTNPAGAIAEFERFRSTLMQATEVLDTYVPEKKSVSEMLSGKTEFEKHEFGKRTDQLETAMQYAYEILRSSRTISENRMAVSQYEVRLDSLKQWDSLNVPMNFKGTAQTSAFIGTLPIKATADEISGMLPDGCYTEIISSSKLQTNIFVICKKEIAGDVYENLRQNMFVPVSDTISKTPQELSGLIESKISELNKKTDDAVSKIRELSANRKILRFMTDYLRMRIDKYSALNTLSFTESTFILNGYIPEKYSGSLAKEIESKYTASVRIYEPEENEDVPVLLENSRFSEPVEGITEMYALPSRHDVDPTPVMSFFYYLFFGMMLSDAGYGLVMVIATSVILKKCRLEEKMRKTMTMFRNCGVSTVIFGALFGSWFGDIVQVVGREFFGKEIGSLALWFEPLDDPIKLLLISFGLGIAHLFLGVAVSFKMRWDEGKKLDAFLDTVPIYITVLGVCPIGAGILTDVPDYLKTIGKYMALVGVILIILTAGRSSGNIFSRFFGGLYALYNTATGYLSDILSYSRLLALGLATGSIAGVINLIGTMPQNTVIKAVLLVIVFVVGHTANLAINLLGAYVHTDRLQFVELFSKFYEGGGRAFSPLSVNTDYIKFKEESINE
jgi:V/A-type H+-transporting ATPase subunit I